jgi:hypothetical protein
MHSRFRSVRYVGTKLRQTKHVAEVPGHLSVHIKDAKSIDT